ncbi:MAG: ATP-binding protein [Pseudomonadota bacterium]
MKTGVRKRLFHAVGKAIQDYAMISHEDRILVGVSGGVDSLVLLEVLRDLREKAPLDFDLVPLHVDPGFENGFAQELSHHVSRVTGHLKVDYTRHGVLAHSLENRENPCFLCSRLRRKRFFQIARQEGCNKIALGHTKDDLIETLFINMCFAGRIGTMKPSQSFFNNRVSMIRPLAYVEKTDILKFARIRDLPEFINPCPSAGFTKRASVRGFLDLLYKENPNVKGNLFRAMGRVETDYLLKQSS